MPSGDKLEERAHKHHTNHKRFTGAKGDWKVVHTELFKMKKESCREAS
jgi:hypothetical protein